MLKRGKSSSITQAVVLCNSTFCIIKLIFYSPFQEADTFYFPLSNFARHILILRHGNFNNTVEKLKKRIQLFEVEIQSIEVCKPKQSHSRHFCSLSHRESKRGGRVSHWTFSFPIFSYQSIK